MRIHTHFIHRIRGLEIFSNHFCLTITKKRVAKSNSLYVVPPGVEPGTQGFYGSPQSFALPIELWVVYNKKRVAKSNSLYVVPPGIEPGTQGFYGSPQSFALPIELWVVYNKKRVAKSNSLYVVPPGIEPGTQGFSVLCSTN